jgi:hypothetical protein
LLIFVKRTTSVDSIGAHSQAAGLLVLRRDVRRHASYFPTAEPMASGRGIFT